MTDQQVRAALASVRWRKSTRSQAQNDCVELAGTHGWVGVRDTKLGATSPVLAVRAAHFAAFVAGLSQHG